MPENDKPEETAAPAPYDIEKAGEQIVQRLSQAGQHGILGAFSQYRAEVTSRLAMKGVTVDELSAIKEEAANSAEVGTPDTKPAKKGGKAKASK